MIALLVKALTTELQLGAIHFFDMTNAPRARSICRNRLLSRAFGSLAGGKSSSRIAGAGW